MNPRKYIDYSILIQSDGVIQASADSIRSAPARIDFHQAELASLYIQAVNDGVVNSTSKLQNLGKLLYNTLFAEPVGGHFREQAWRKVFTDPHQETCVRLRIIFQQGVTPHIMNMPWEFLFHPTQEIFLGTYPKFSVSYKLEDWYDQYPEPRADDVPIRVLFAHMHPEDLDGIGTSPVRNAIGELKKEDITFHELTDPSVTSLKETIQKFRPHIFHFLGHGQFQEGHGSFAFSDKSGNAFWYDSQSFSILFGGWLPSLMVLQACESGQISENSTLSGGIAWLVRQNVPAVVGMRYPFEQGAGWIFIRKFYELLSQN